MANGEHQAASATAGAVTLPVVVNRILHRPPPNQSFTNLHPISTSEGDETRRRRARRRRRLRHAGSDQRTDVGDKYVLEEMLRSGANLGGEPSGHIIFADRSLAGDGLVTLLEMLRIMTETGQEFAEVVRGLHPFPQKITNVRVREKPPLESVPGVGEALAACRDDLGKRGRVVVRYSGTEPVARVMVEAESAELVERHVTRIAEAIARTLGSAEGKP